MREAENVYKMPRYPVCNVEVDDVSSIYGKCNNCCEMWKMKKCPKCGYELVEGECPLCKICKKCGKPVRECECTEGE